MESSRLKLRGTFRNIVSWTCFLLLQGKSEDLWSKVAACLFGFSCHPCSPDPHQGIPGENFSAGAPSLSFSSEYLRSTYKHEWGIEGGIQSVNANDTSHLSRWPNFIHKSCHHPLNLLEFPHRILPLLFFFFYFVFFLSMCPSRQSSPLFVLVKQMIDVSISACDNHITKDANELLFGIRSWFPTTSLVPGASLASHRKKDHLSLKGFPSSSVGK